MPRIHFGAFLIASLIVPCTLAESTANAQPMPSPIVEFPVAGDPQGITTGPDGNIWFTEYSARKIGRMTSAGVITEFPFPFSSVSPPFGRPYAITAGPDGNLWFTMIALDPKNPSGSGGGVGRITPTGTLTTFNSASCCSSPSGIAAGPDGNLWVIDLDTTLSSVGSIMRITPTGSITTFPLAPFFGGQYQNLLPEAISAGPDGNVWFTAVTGPQIPQASSYVGRITPTGSETVFKLPFPRILWGITSGPDGNLWFTESGRFGEPDQDAIGQITPAGTITEFPIPKVANSSAARPVAIVTGPDGNLWFTEADANKIGRVTTAGVCVEFAVPTSNRRPTGFGPNITNGPFWITNGPDGNMWFSEPIGQKIGRIAGTAAPGGNANLVWRQTQTGDLGLWSLSGLSIRSENQLAAGVSPVWQVSAVG
ncbi:MAG TPA: hypothetical protein VGZ27_19365, partial [Vicinamibacterales bacterium]|nr:hypothetical protein [Vicinamibacterales bacterium]